MRVVEQSERPDRKVYHITEEGHAPIAPPGWPAKCKTPPNRSQALIQVFAAQLPRTRKCCISFRDGARVRGLLHLYEDVPAQLRVLDESVHWPAPHDNFSGILRWNRAGAPHKGDWRGLKMLSSRAFATVKSRHFRPTKLCEKKRRDTQHSGRRGKGV